MRTVVLLNIPNTLSVLRIFLVPLLIWLIISDQMQFAFVAFLLAGLSDAVDGYLAKKFHWETELGAYLDPIADKALLMGVYATLGVYGYLPAWLVIMVISRDILIIVAVMLAWMLEHPFAMRPLLLSKVNTVGQIILAALTLGVASFSLPLTGTQMPLMWGVGILTILSTAVYLFTWFKHMASDKPLHEVEVFKTLGSIDQEAPRGTPNGRNESNISILEKPFQPYTPRSDR